MRRTVRFALETAAFVLVTAVGTFVDWQVRHSLDRRAMERAAAETEADQKAKQKPKKHKRRPNTR